MGNCLERSRGRHGCGGGGGDDGATLHCATEKKRPVVVEDPEEKVHENGEKPPAPGVTEVKIRITRKQLEELLRRLEEGKEGGEGGGAVVSELLCMTSSCNFRHRPEQWRPSLQVIPE